MSVAVRPCGLRKSADSETVVDVMASSHSSPRIRRIWWAPVLMALLLGCSPESGGSTPMPRSDGGPPVGADTDGDGISDEDEGRADNVDTDSDGTPDYLDDDSDGDEIADRIEAGRGAAPADSDSDGVPDFRDRDSDNNGIEDGEDGDADTDGDGTPDFADLDDDNDFVRDSEELEAGLVDTDADGVPDFRDRDSDDDGIIDGHEPATDPDMDGLNNRADTDSDADGIPDSEEAGDDDPDTVPVDTDEDGTPDFLDPDSDGDGISDLQETEAGTDPRDEDSDDDGVSDLIEVAAGTDPLDNTDDPRARGDFVFVVPFEETPMPERDTLEFATSIQIADVYFLFDTTGSMSGEIAAMGAAVQGILESTTCMDTGTACMEDTDCGMDQVCSLAGTCIEDPTIDGCIASLWSGVGTYAGNRNTYRNLLSIQDSPAMTRARIPGADGPGADETLFESVACVADPSRCSGAGCTAGGIGCPAFREAAVRILVTLTDEMDECSGCPVGSAAAAAAPLVDQGITFVGVDADSDHEPRNHLRAIANASMSLDSMGAPLVFEGSEAAVTSAVSAAIGEIVNGVPLRVTIEGQEVDGDDGDALRFIDYLEVNTTSPGCSAAESEDTDADGHNDAFPALRPGTGVCWDVVPVMNTIQEAGDRPLVYQARLEVAGDGSPLDSRTVYFLVPPEIRIPSGPM